MPSTRSYQEPTSTITVEYSASTLSRWGFFPVVLYYLRSRRLPERLRQITVKTAANGLYSPVDKLMSLVTIFVLGLPRIRGYPVLFSCVFRYLKGTGFFDGSGLKSRSIR